MRQPAGEKEKLSVRGYLLQMAERPGPEAERALDRLEGPPVPDALAYLWRWFLKLDAMRTYGMAGPNPLSADIIAAGDRLYGWGLDPLEVDALLVLDRVVRSPGDDDETEPEATEPPAWPTRKG